MLSDKTRRELILEFKQLLVAGKGKKEALLELSSTYDLLFGWKIKPESLMRQLNRWKRKFQNLKLSQKNH